MKSQFNYLWLLIFAGTLLVASCNNDVNDDPIKDSAKGVKLSNNATYGNIITDNLGHTLYFFANDANGQANCTNECIAIWPIFYVEDLQIEAPLDANNFSEIMNADGKMQITYKGWPLYYYSPNADGGFEEPGVVSCDAYDNSWFVAKPDYTIMIANNQLIGHDGNMYLSDYTTGSALTKYFTDSYGRTIYRFIKDNNSKNNFTKEDFSNNSVWPVYYSEINAIPSILNKNDFGKIDVFGHEQLTYKGNPLYYFGQDMARGDNKGISYPSPGIWPIVNETTMEAEAAAKKVTIKISQNSTFGQILTDGEGRALYFFTKDVNGLTHCTGGCNLNWPVFYAESLILEEGSTLSVNDFSEIALPNNSKQTTYKGWPLYYFSASGDGVIENAGTVGGDGVNNVWYVAKESYSLMIADNQLTGNDGINYTSLYTKGDETTKYFTDIMGRTIYYFTKDSASLNKFTKPDFSNNEVWPIFYTEINTLPSAIDKSLFNEITVYGRKQLTYKGWPLYYYGNDVARGENKGISVPTPGVWPIVNSNTMQAPALE
jgi:predicted lipoprotein with Yx(FWY)xxD motif